MPLGLRHPIDVEGAIDAICITHGHADHFNVASILACATDADTPIIVLLCLGPACLLRTTCAQPWRMFGQATIAPAWGTSLFRR
jgi:L-ascorbate metabolism protein UlaG (beta-lactamase superfamily)